jgi:hypothetical protein
MSKHTRDVAVEVVEAQLGDRWDGSPGELEAFGEILAGVTGRPVRIVTYTRHGASGVSEEQWNRALDIHAQRYPAAWR